jgi:hypothetical protein
MCARHRRPWHQNPKPHIALGAPTLTGAMDNKKPRQMDRRQRMEAILERDGDLCVWCSVRLVLGAVR